MEELRSTDALDREILEDARKKADKILKTAEAAISKAQAEWAARIEHDITEMQGRIETATRERIDEIQGRMPLDRRRLRSEFAGNALKSSLNSWLDALPRDMPSRDQIGMELRGLIDERLERGQPLDAVARRMNREPAEAALTLMDKDALRTGAFFFGMSEANLWRILAEPCTWAI